MRIEILSEEPELTQALTEEFGSPKYGSVARNQLGVEVEWQTPPRNKLFDSADVIKLVVTNLMSVGTSVLSRWLYDRLSSRRAKLRIDGSTVETSAASIDAAIAARMTANSKIKADDRS